MKVVPLSLFQRDPQTLQHIREILERGGIVCVPTGSGYKLLADLEAPKAVLSLLQAKRRVKSGPALIFLPDDSHVEKVAAKVTDEARSLMGRFWPGPLTLLFDARDDLHPKVRKALTKAKGWLGMRVTDDETPARIVKDFGKPVLVSSANLSNKVGAESVAQVKKNFGRVIDLLVDDGDVPLNVTSTLVDVTEAEVKFVRAGAVSTEAIEEALNSGKVLD